MQMLGWPTWPNLAPLFSPLLTRAWMLVSRSKFSLGSWSFSAVLTTQWPRSWRALPREWIMNICPPKKPTQPSSQPGKQHWWPPDRWPSQLKRHYEQLKLLHRWIPGTPVWTGIPAPWHGDVGGWTAHQGSIPASLERPSPSPVSQTTKRKSGDVPSMPGGSLSRLQTKRR